MEHNQISFLPEDYLERKIQRRTNAICAALFLVVIGGVVGAFMIAERRTKELDSEYAQVEDQYLNEARRIEQVRQMQQKQKRMAHQAELTASLLERVPRSYLLAEMTNALPAGVSLLDFTMESKVRVKVAPVSATAVTAYEQKKAALEAQNAAATTAQAEAKLYDVSMKLTGTAHTDVQVAQYLNRLSRSRFLQDVNLVISDEFAVNDEKLRKFQIEMMLNPGVEVQPGDVRAGPTVNVELKE